MTNECTSQIEALAALIREVDGRHDLGAAALAEALVDRGVRVATPREGPGGPPTRKPKRN